MTKLTRYAVLPLAAIFSLIVSSCSDDDSSPAKGSYVLSLAVQGADQAFTYYTVPYEDVMTGSLSAAGQGISQPGYYSFKKIDNTIYSIGGLGQVDVKGITQNADKELEENGNATFATSPADIVKADENNLVAVEITPSIVKFHLINPNTVVVSSSKELQTSVISQLPGNIKYSGMVVSGSHLFLSYYISDPNDNSTKYTDNAAVAVFSYPALEFQKVITDDRTGPLGGFLTRCGLTKTENGDVYALSNSNPSNGYSQTTKKGAILRIKNGETEFDKNYFFDVEAVTSGFNINHLMYLENGKAFVEVNADKNADQARWSDGPLKSAILDLNNKTVSYISGVPQHAGVGRLLPALYDDSYVYLPVPEATSIYVYRINTRDNSVTKGAEIQANFVAGFYRY